MALILTHDDVAGILSTAEVVDAVRAGLLEQAAGNVALPPRTTVHAPGGQGWLRVMPAILGGSGVMGYKAMHSTPKVGVRYLVALCDMASGALLAQIDADWLTAQRTAAIGALAADHLANRSIERCGVLGSSDQSRALLAAVASVRQPGRVMVFSPTVENRDRFAADMEAALNLCVTPVERARDAVEGCDLVLSAFGAGPDPVISADWIAPGAHLNAGSSILPNARELVEDVVAPLRRHRGRRPEPRLRVGRRPKRARGRGDPAGRSGRAVGSPGRSGTRPQVARRHHPVQGGRHRVAGYLGRACGIPARRRTRSRS